MHTLTFRITRFAACVAAAVVTLAAGQGTARQPAEPRLYVMPLWLPYLGADDATFAREVGELRRRLGPDGDGVRLGFTAYIFIKMNDWNVDVSRTQEVVAALADTVAQVDSAIARARRHAVPLCLSFLTALRDNYDPAQTASELEDRRNMQWYGDNDLAKGWWTHSQYARKQRRVQEAYMRAIGRIVANRMARYPDTLVAASGDGEVELAYGKSPSFNKAYTVETMEVADYSPFAVAEFRDWLRGGGWYATGQPLAAEAYERAARYAEDLSPAADTNRDGHTLNGDFGTAFTTWELRYFDWSLTDDPARDPRAIPAFALRATAGKPASSSSATAAKAGSTDATFDPPRKWKQGDPWWEVWHTFRQMMLWRHNRDVARWVTTSRDPATGTTVPAERWYSDQIAADYLFGFTPENPNLRFISSASAWWTADVSPHGRLGITSFNTNMDGAVSRTLAAVAPQIGPLDADWGILEWNPSSPAMASPDVYRAEMRLVELYRPSLIVPIYWGDKKQQIQDTGFEIALRELVANVKKGWRKPEIDAAPPRLNFAVAPGGRTTPAQPLHVRVAGRGAIAWQLASGNERLVLSATSGTKSTTVEIAIRDARQITSEIRTTVTLTSPDASTPPITIPVLVKLLSGAPGPPSGSFDAPAEGAGLANGVLLAGGWAVDDLGVLKVEVWREALPGERPEAGGLIRLGEAARGTRPDVAALYPDAPFIDRVAWNYHHDLSALAAAEPRTLRIHVLATDVEGNVADLGARTVVVRR